MNQPLVRIGVVVSPPNTVCEIEFNRMAPESVSVHAARLFRKTEPGKLTKEVLKATNADLDRAAASLKAIQPNVVAFPHTLGSMVDGPLYDRELVRLMEQNAGCPAVTTSIALLEALHELHLERIAVAAPYQPELTKIELEYFQQAMPKLTVVSEYSVGAETGFGIGQLSPATAFDAARWADRPEAQAVFLSGTNWLSTPVLEDLEAKLGKLVLTANQVTLWACLRRLGIPPVNGPGTLLRRG